MRANRSNREIFDMLRDSSPTEIAAQRTLVRAIAKFLQSNIFKPISATTATIMPITNPFSRSSRLKREVNLIRTTS